MYLIVGLGNPEEEYSGTRHNMGFDAINAIAKTYNICINRKKFDALYGDGIIEGKKVILLKPQTYMNLSGESIRQVVEFYKLKLEDILVIYDDMDVEKGNIKIRKKGGTGSHNGMKSIIHNLKSEDFARIRIGIGRPEETDDKINYVIGKVETSEREKLEEGIQKATKAVKVIIENGIDNAMNAWN